MYIYIYIYIYIYKTKKNEKGVSTDRVLPPSSPPDSIRRSWPTSPGHFSNLPAPGPISPTRWCGHHNAAVPHGLSQGPSRPPHPPCRKVPLSVKTNNPKILFVLYQMSNMEFLSPFLKVPVFTIGILKCMRIL